LTPPPPPVKNQNQPASAPPLKEMRQHNNADTRRYCITFEDISVDQTRQRWMGGSHERV